jgi:sec-independent protein translocase protein TatA
MPRLPFLAKTYFSFNLILHIPMLETYMMNVGGSEWLIIGLLVVILLFGSKKLPEFSRSIGKAIGEFEKMRDTTLVQKTDEDSNYLGPRVVGAVDDERHKLEMIAESLGIDHVNKKDEELRLLIFDKINR